MHASEPGRHACIPCMLQLTVSRPPDRTWINHYNIQMPQSAQEKVPSTQPTNPSARDSCDVRISQARRCTRRVHKRHDTCISWLPKMHAYSMLHAPVGVMLTCCHQIRLQLGVPLPREPTLGVLSSRRPIQGVLFSQRSTLGVQFPHIPMNLSSQLSKTLQRAGK